VKKLNVMQLTYDMRIGGTEMLLKNIARRREQVIVAIAYNSTLLWGMLMFAMWWLKFSITKGLA
jgi:hypothetical protein